MTIISDHNILVIGLGSMGKRRIRCLQALGYTNITGYDWRQDRCLKSNVPASIGRLLEDPSHVLICTTPDTHNEYADDYKGIPCFIEEGTEEVPGGTPSDTMAFHPGIMDLKAKLPQIGNVLNVTYHCGQYLPDWHPYENVEDFYVRYTGAVEMVAFELMWFTKIFGFPDGVISTKREPGETEIDGLKASDTVAAILMYDKGLVANLMIDVVARKPIRQLVVNGSKGQLVYDLNEGISEQIYVDETKAFMDGKYPNTVEHTNKVIELMRDICQ